MAGAFEILGPGSATLSSAPNIKRSFSCYFSVVFQITDNLPSLKAGIRKQRDIVADSGIGSAFRFEKLLKQ